MKKIMLIAMLLIAPAIAGADQYVNGYTKGNGTYVPGHMRSSPNSTTSDNWSTKGNTNPYTGQKGTRSQSGSSGYGYGQPQQRSRQSSSPYGGY